MTKIWAHGESDYMATVNEYNKFLEKFGPGIVRNLSGK